MSTATTTGTQSTAPQAQPQAHDGPASSTTTRRERVARNGVDVPRLFVTLDVVKGQPAAAQFQFRARNEWVSGTHSRSSIQGFFGAGQEDSSRTAPFVYDADHPEVLVGGGNAPTPVEFLLHAIAACLTAGLVNVASARGITLRSVSSRVEGDINLLGIFGMAPDVRNGYSEIRVHFDVDGDASADELAALVEQSRSRSAVYDVLTNGTTVSVDVTTP